MKHAYRSALALFSILTPFIANAATPSAPTQETTCSISGWSTDADPHGLNVRSAPDAKAPIIATLPPVRYQAASDTTSPLGIGPSFAITASNNGWLKIQHANDDDSMIIDQEPRATYKGTGWVWGGKASLKIQSTRGFAKPDARSDVIITDKNAFDSDDAVADIIACDGPWVLADVHAHVTASPQSNSVRAWFRGACGVRETTCDGVASD